MEVLYVVKYAIFVVYNI